MKDYHKLYLKCDALFLADVSENFRNNSFKNYGLFPSNYLTALVFSQDVMLNMTEFGFELISDADMYLFFDKVMMGDISFISKRYSKANNKYLKYYDPKQESKHFKYLNTRFIHIVMRCLNFFQHVESYGKILKTLIQPNIAAVVTKDVFRRLILNILKNYVNYI